MLTNPETRVRFEAARVIVLKSLPYLAPLACNTVHNFSPRVPTAGVDKRGRVYWNPAFLDTLDTKQTAGVMVHELLHWVYDHWGRVGTRDHETWNIAADVVINDDVRAAGLTLPQDAVLREDLKVPDACATAEAVYDWLTHDPKGQKAMRNMRAPKPECGSGAGGMPGEWEEPDSDGQDAGGVAPGDAALVRRQIAEAVQAHAKQAGTMPAGLTVWADTVCAPPRVPWRAKLAVLLARAGSSYRRGRASSDWRRVSRRTPATRVHMPGRVEPIPRIACIIDTSGSMWGSGAAVLGEAMGIIKAADAGGVDFVGCDAEAGRVFSAGDLRTLRAGLQGGGGTDLNPAVAALGNVSRYSAIVIFTDGYLDRVAVPAGPRVLWCLVPGATVCPWMRERGEIIELAD